MIWIRFSLIFIIYLDIIQAQSYRWQQLVEYRMEIDFDSDKHQFEGKQSLKHFRPEQKTNRDRAFAVSLDHP